jgi:2-polyprenyl-3-methyl-5-hydroxy-6-metoxy-1,4-benzoquinol methylase
MTAMPDRSIQAQAAAKAEKCWVCGGVAELDPMYASVPLSRCTNCGFVFAPQRGTEELHGLYTDDYFEQYPGGEAYAEDLAQRRYEATRRRDWLIKTIPQGSLLEIGATNGEFLDVMREAGFSVCGVEPAPGPAEFARSERGLDVRTGFIEDVALPELKFDAICAWNVLEHITEPHAAIKRLRNAIAEDGRLFLEIPNIESVLAKRRGVNWFHLDPAHHVAFYTPAQLAQLLESCGFELVTTTTVSGTSYLNPKRARAPREIAELLRYAALTRSAPRREDPVKHELMRAIARPIAAAQ